VTPTTGTGLRRCLPPTFVDVRAQAYPAQVSSTPGLVDVDHELATRLRAGDAAAFHQLLGKYSSNVLARLRALGIALEQAEDLTQETWLRVWQHRQSFLDGNFRGWLMTIAGNVARTHQRKPHLPLIDNADAFAALPPKMTSDRVDALRECLADLDDQFVDAVRDDYAGLTTEEIARKNNISLDTVASRIHRGRKRLKDCIQRRLS
jgi:RNA polymerase sigma factor (sigma-70 family)